MDAAHEYPRTLEDAVVSIVSTLDEAFREQLLAIPRGQLIKFHHGWGTGIRNAFGLWGKNSELLAECGSPMMHADDASMVIMNAVWNRLRGISIDDARIKNYRSPDEIYRELGPDKLYRHLRFLASGKRNREQNIYRMLQRFFGLGYREFKELAARLDAEDRIAEDDN